MKFFFTNLYFLVLFSFQIWCNNDSAMFEEISDVLPNYQFIEDNIMKAITKNIDKKERSFNDFNKKLFFVIKNIENQSTKIISEMAEEAFKNTEELRVSVLKYNTLKLLHPGSLINSHYNYLKYSNYLEKIKKYDDHITAYENIIAEINDECKFYVANDKMGIEFEVFGEICLNKENLLNVTEKIENTINNRSKDENNEKFLITIADCKLNSYDIAYIDMMIKQQSILHIDSKNMLVYVRKEVLIENDDKGVPKLDILEFFKRKMIIYNVFIDISYNFKNFQTSDTKIEKYDKDKRPLSIFFDKLEMNLNKNPRKKTVYSNLSIKDLEIQSLKFNSGSKFVYRCLFYKIHFNLVDYSHRLYDTIRNGSEQFKIYEFYFIHTTNSQEFMFYFIFDNDKNLKYVADVNTIYGTPNHDEEFPKFNLEAFFANLRKFIFSQSVNLNDRNILEVEKIGIEEGLVVNDELVRENVVQIKSWLPKLDEKFLEKKKNVQNEIEEYFRTQNCRVKFFDFETKSVKKENLVFIINPKSRIATRDIINFKFPLRLSTFNSSDSCKIAKEILNKTLKNGYSHVRAPKTISQIFQNPSNELLLIIKTMYNNYSVPVEHYLFISCDVATKEMKYSVACSDKYYDEHYYKLVDIIERNFI
ncbi:hypothetical protein CWI36_1013p0010 [Hamiltosporidium magnivora]|uniref:Uncharacterized protein n=1 Tax=Hamiltosporidium magnivora TaxID=148818 RepID=A0A4Q9L5T5_9MICR|nr:hypothetical protein CWI36_1013p0010 [Hamiltosporidium magnivora]